MLFVSAASVAELVDVTGRPIVARKLRTTMDRLRCFVEDVERLTVRLDDVPAAFAHPTDAKDDPIINLAIAAGAHVITSRDRQLLALRDASTTASAEFMSRFGSIEVLTPVELLERLRTK